MSILLQSSWFLIEVLTCQIVFQDYPITEVSPVLHGGSASTEILIISETDSCSAIYGLDIDAVPVWADTFSAGSIACLEHFNNGLIVITTPHSYPSIDTMYVFEMDIGTGQILDEHLLCSDHTEPFRALVALPGVGLRVLSNTSIYGIDETWSLELLGQLPGDISAVEGASPMADGSIEVLGTHLEQVFCFWLDPDGTLLDLEDWGVFPDGIQYSYQQYEKAVFLEYNVDYPDYYEIELNLRNVSFQPGSTIFCKTLYSSSVSSCVTEAGGLVTVCKSDDGGSASIDIRKFDQAGNLLWDNSVPWILSDDLHISGVVPVSDGYAIAGSVFHGPGEPGDHFIMLLDESGNLPGLTDPSNPFEVSISPNPFSGTAVIMLQTGQIASFQFSIIDMSGRCVHVSDEVEISESTSMEIGPLPEGVYLINTDMRDLNGNVFSRTITAVSISD